MRRWKLVGLAGLMVFSLLGIIWVQLIWINNAIAIRNGLFNKLVYQSLQSTARKIESDHHMEFYKRMMVADSLLQSQSTDMITNPFAFGDIYPDNDGNIVIRSRTVGTSETFSFKLTDNGREVRFSGDYQAATITDSIPHIIKHNNRVAALDDTRYAIGIELVVNQQEFRQWVRKKSVELRRMGDQMVDEIYNWDLNTTADKNIVLQILQSELGNSGIITPFEFAILEDNKIVDGLFNRVPEKDFFSSNYSVALFTDRLIRRDTRLSLVFPQRKNYILGSMSIILGASMLFSIIILVTFSLSIFFIIRQKKISEMKSDFINNMTHEFKTPIATISLAADTISNPKVIGDKERIRHFIGMIKKENIRMDKQVENILQISSIDSRDMEFNFQYVDVHSIINRSIETIGIQVEQKKGNIFFFPEAENPFIEGDREHLTNLVHNLLDNANKYSLKNPEITVRTEMVNNSLMISVEDKGIGMNRSIQSKIFERFYRQARGNVHNVKGFGLGLSYVRAIVEAHKGHIELFSESGKGTRFEVYLPQNSEN
ncbi:MAG: HAMP domain-containing histidine kinase [Bacteroidales bacterium]|nr:HAMP domain-containing histidine kinase [Bacteroidales bacterium]